MILRTYSIQIDGTLIASGTSSNEAQFASGQITFATTSNGWNSQTNAGSQFSYVNINSTSIQSSVPLKVSYCQTSGSIQMGGGSEILDSTTSSTVTVAGSCTVSDNTMIAPNLASALSITGGSSQISNNHIGGGGSRMTYFPSVGVYTVGAVQVSQGTAMIQNNIITGPVEVGNSSMVTDNNIDGGVIISDGSPTISNNTIVGAITVNSGQAPAISQNTISGSITINSGSPQITDNYVSGNRMNLGIGVSSSYTGGNVLIADNYMMDCCYGGAFWSNSGSATFQYNQITNCQYGMSFSGGTLTITDNTLQNNTISVVLQNPMTIQALNDNNIVESQQSSIYLDNYTANVDATNNWWGTTNQQVINQTFYDFFNNYNLGIVNFIPFLTAPNSKATPNIPAPSALPSTPTPTPASSTPSQSTPTPTQPSSSVTSPTPTSASSVPELSWLVIVPLLLSVFSVAVILRHRKSKVKKVLR